MQNIARNQEMVRKLFEGKASPATKANMKRKKKVCPPEALSHARAALAQALVVIVVLLVVLLVVVVSVVVAVEVVEVVAVVAVTVVAVVLTVIALELSCVAGITLLNPSIERFS